MSGIVHNINRNIYEVHKLMKVHKLMEGEYSFKKKDDCIKGYYHDLEEVIQLLSKWDGGSKTSHTEDGNTVGASEPSQSEISLSGSQYDSDSSFSIGRRKPMTSKTRRRRRKCPRGTIHRKGYTNKRGVTVRSSCIKDRGLPGKGKRLFTLKKGELGKHGYSLKQAREKRRVALNKARKELSHATLVRKINALAILMKNTHPDYSRRARADVKWLGKTRK